MMIMTNSQIPMTNHQILKFLYLKIEKLDIDWKLLNWKLKILVRCKWITNRMSKNRHRRSSLLIKQNVSVAGFVSLLAQMFLSYLTKIKNPMLKMLQPAPPKGAPLEPNATVKKRLTIAPPRQFSGRNNRSPVPVKSTDLDFPSEKIGSKRSARSRPCSSPPRFTFEDTWLRSVWKLKIVNWKLEDICTIPSLSVPALPAWRLPFT